MMLEIGRRVMPRENRRARAENPASSMQRATRKRSIHTVSVARTGQIAPSSAAGANRKMEEKNRFPIRDRNGIPAQSK